MRSTPIEELERKLWSKVKKTEGGGCWEWQGAVHEFGYGLVRFWVDGKQERYAHRLSWFIHFGGMDNRHVLHDCDNPRCCRPDHLFLGTHLQNIHDMVSKKRHGVGLRHPMAKLNPELINECRNRFEAGETLLALSREFNVSSAVLHRAIYGKGWKGCGEPLEQTTFGILQPGEQHPKAKMTDETVMEARRKRSLGAGVSDLAREYGIGKATMSKILRREYWKHVT